MHGVGLGANELIPIPVAAPLARTVLNHVLVGQREYFSELRNAIIAKP